MKNLKRSLSLRRYAALITVIGVAVLVADMMASFLLIVLMQQETERRLSESIASYVNSVEQNLYSAQQYLNWSIYRDENIRLIDDAKTIDLSMVQMQILHNQFTIMQQGYTVPFQFFLYLQETGSFTNRGSMLMPYSAFVDLRKQLIENIDKTSDIGASYPNWEPYWHEDDAYLVSIAPYGNRYLLCIVSVKDMVAPLTELSTQNDRFVAVTSKKEDILLGAERLEENAIDLSSFRNSLSNSHILLEAQMLNGRYTIHYALARYGVFETTLIAQLTLAMLVLIMGGVLFFSALYIRFKVMVPIQRFSENLKLFRDGDSGEPIDLTSSRIVELEQVNEQVRSLAEQVRELKIDIYERERERQKIQLEYLQLQIKPHFFLNCLTSIDGMAQLGMNEEISQMSQTTSAYFRYVFMSNQDFVSLKNEMDHICNYLDIHKLRYGSALHYQIVCDEDLTGIAIPPLTLQPFIENAVRHAVTLDDEVWIRIFVQRHQQEGNSLISIRIIDTGKGFAPDILTTLQDGDVLFTNAGGHIGIRNTLQRLKLFFEDRVDIVFANDQEWGGASIAITIPYEPFTKGDTAS